MYELGILKQISPEMLCNTWYMSPRVSDTGPLRYSERAEARKIKST